MYHHEEAQSDLRGYNRWNHISYAAERERWTGFKDSTNKTPTSSTIFRGFDVKVFSGTTMEAHSSSRNNWSRRSSQYLVVEQWFALLVLLILPGWRLRQALAARKRKRAIAMGKCAHCGYDLRASGERCPECGAAAPAAAAPAGNAPA